MRVLIAEDDPLSARLLQATLQGWGYEPVMTADGLQAWEALRDTEESQLAILDWMMPELDGIEVCRRVRAGPSSDHTYLLLVTARDEKGDVIAGLEAGANDYVTKPYDRDELRARIHVGERVLELQRALASRVRELEAALAEVQQLRGILPICCYCKKVRNDELFWERVEDYLAAHAPIDFTHGICPECWESVVNPQLEQELGVRLPYEE